MTEKNTSIFENEQALAQGVIEVSDEESLAAIVGAKQNGIMKAINTLKNAIAGRREIQEEASHSSSSSSSHSSSSAHSQSPILSGYQTGSERRSLSSHTESFGASSDSSVRSGDSRRTDDYYSGYSSGGRAV